MFQQKGKRRRPFVPSSPRKSPTLLHYFGSAVKGTTSKSDSAASVSASQEYSAASEPLSSSASPPIPLSRATRPLSLSLDLLPFSAPTVYHPINPLPLSQSSFSIQTDSETSPGESLLQSLRHYPIQPLPSSDPSDPDLRSSIIHEDSSTPRNVHDRTANTTPIRNRTEKGRRVQFFNYKQKVCQDKLAEPIQGTSERNTTSPALKPKVSVSPKPNNGVAMSDSDDVDDNNNSDDGDHNDDDGDHNGDDGDHNDDDGDHNGDGGDHNGDHGDGDSESESDSDLSPNLVATTAKELYKLLTEDHGYCTEEEHALVESQHREQMGSNHHKLSVTYKKRDKWQRSGKVESGLQSSTFPDNHGVPRRVYTSASAMSELFEGVTNQDEDSVIPNVCLHAESSPAAEPLISYDVDSLLAIPRGLDAFRTGFRYCPATHFSWNIRANLHIKRQVRFVGLNGKEKHQSLHLRDIPHLYIGGFDGFFNSTVHIFFPRLIKESQKFTFLTQEQTSRFTDDIMIPACRAHLNEDQIQRMPQNQEMAEINARAKGLEHTTRKGEIGLKTFTYYSLCPDSLSDIWETIQKRIHDPNLGLSDFEDAFLFVNAKGIKSDFNAVGSLTTALSKFERKIQDTFHLDRMEDIFLDIGRDITPPNTSAIQEDLDSENDAIVYLWRDCCLRRRYHSFVANQFGGRKGTATFYQTGFLRDATCMTLVPPARSSVRRGGWLYGQWYNSVKDILDSQTVYPFTNPRLRELAIDKEILTAHHHSTKMSHGRDRGLPIRTYCESKMRVRKSYLIKQTTSFGIRMEFRVNWALSLAINARAKKQEERHELAVRLQSHPHAAWSIRTRSFAEFMMGNYEKLTSTLEIAVLTSPKQGISFQRSKVIMALLRCLQNLSSQNLASQPALWYNAQRDGDSVLRGLGFGTTVAEHGYAWFLPVIDWEGFCFKPEIAAEMYDADHDLLRWYGLAGRSIQDTAQVLDLCCERLTQGCGSKVAQDEIMRLMAHMCFRQFRRDELTALANEVRGSVDTDDQKDAIQFCCEGLSEVFIDHLHYVSGNKTRTKTPEALVEWLWLSTGDHPRKHFVDKPFRVMYRKVETAVEDRTGMGEEWIRIFMAEFFRHHWVWPYPDINGTLISTQKKGGARLWFGIDRKSDGEWVWARDQPRRGRPPAYPASLAMDTEALTAHLNGLG